MLFAVISKMSIVATTVSNAGLDFKLHAGYSAETSGKESILMPKSNVFDIFYGYK